MLQVGYFAPLTLIGMTLSTSLVVVLHRYGLIVLFSVRAKLRNGAPGYDFTSSFLLRCLYEDEEGDHLCPEEGFLKGPLLLRVSFSPLGPMCTMTITLTSDLPPHIHIAFVCLR